MPVASVVLFMSCTPAVFGRAFAPQALPPIPPESRERGILHPIEPFATPYLLAANNTKMLAKCIAEGSCDAGGVVFLLPCAESLRYSYPKKLIENMFLLPKSNI